MPETYRVRIDVQFELGSPPSSDTLRKVDIPAGRREESQTMTVIGEEGSAESVAAGGRSLLSHVAAVGVEGLVAEYTELRGVDFGLAQEHFNDRRNKEKNRYKDVGCWDATRVILEEPVGTEEGDESDYVHANFIDGPRHSKEFIATQAPMEHTVEEWWHMVWEQRVGVVVMLCLCKENGRRKCEQYWKLERGGSLVLETGYTVRTLERETIRLGDHNLVQTHLSLCKSGDVSSRNLLHILHTNWPDKSLPPSSEPLVSLCRKLNSLQRIIAASNGIQPSASPKLVHCSAGVGRTGTLIALDSALATIDQGIPLDILHLVTNLRKQRKSAVQNSHQYVFLCLTLAEYVVAKCPQLAGIANLQPLRDHRNTPINH